MATDREKSRVAASKAIADDLRHQCVLGQLPPGTRLPRRDEMVRKYSASATTVQHAIDQLVADGLLEARGRAGTYVAEKPRHVTDIALVFPARREDFFKWRHFYDVLAASAALWQSEPPRHFRPYCCEAELENSAELERLHDDLQNMRLGGVIHATTTMNHNLHQWQQKFHAPFVCVLPSHVPFDMGAAVVLSFDSFFSRAIEFLAQRGRRRIAIVLDPQMYFRMEREHIDREAKRCGIEIRPAWRQLVPVGSPLCAQSVTHLLMSAPPAERPDGLIVADDNMVPYAVQGLNDAGVRPGADLDLVVHCNFPNASSFQNGGITRLGFDSRAILQAALQLIDAARQTGKNDGSTELNAVFERERWNVDSP